MIKILSQILNYSPFVVVPAVFILAALAYWKKKGLRILIWVMIGFHLGLALIKSILQYWVWNQGGLTQPLLNLPLEKLNLSWFTNLPIFTGYAHGYFLYYIWNNFWKEALLSVAAAFIAYGIFLLSRKYKKSLFPDREAELGFLMALLVGWPQIILFLPLVLIIAVIFSIINWFYKREASCSLFWPFIASAAIVLVFNNQLAAWRFLIFNF